ncbi:MAG: hypothetical protein JXR97_02405 [Planctomycetes bacterium]|nr:hypothetical protein [Planctomycetota bacterium]
MSKKKHAKSVLAVLPWLVFLAGLAMTIWADEITYHYIMLRRPGTLKLTAISLTEYYRDDCMLTGVCCIATALAWWILMQKFGKR